MLSLRHSAARGVADFGWLASRHTFSFGDYLDPEHMGFAALRVINEDRVQPGKGFDTHGHRDMEILSYVLAGALEHKDSLGTGSVIRPGEVQRMSAGTGITHSEYNPSSTEPVHFLQIWIVPETTGLAPGYEQKAFPPDWSAGRLCLVASRNGRHGSVTIHRDVDLHVARLGRGETVSHPLIAGRRAWVQVARGSLAVNAKVMRAGDGLAVEDEPIVTATGIDRAEILLFDMA